MWRRNVVAVIFNEDGEVLACNRKDRKGWQCVQGGVEDSDTELVEAAWREIEEEIGLRQSDHGLMFAAHIPPPNGDPTQLRYLLPKYAAPSLRAKGFIGQQQELVLFFAPRAAIEHVNLIPTAAHAAAGAKQEFRGVAWMHFEEFLPRTNEFKRHIFEHMRAASRPLMDTFFASQPVMQRIKAAPVTTGASASVSTPVNSDCVEPANGTIRVAHPLARCVSSDAPDVGGIAGDGNISKRSREDVVVHTR